MPLNDLLTIVFRDEDAGLCTKCSERVGQGPIGWAKDKGPLCDACLTEQHAPLGMVLVIVNLVREIGSHGSRDSNDDLHLMGLLLNLARLYTVSASKSWPTRSLEFLQDFQTAVDHPETMDDCDA